MYTHSLFQKDSMPLLRSMTQFTAKRHELLVQDIANVDTPNYRSKKLDLNAFQDTLQKAIDRREKNHPRHFQIGSSAQVQSNATAVASTGGFSTTNDSFLGTIHTRQSSLGDVGSSQVSGGIRGKISFRPHTGKNEGVYRYDQTSGSIDKTMSDLAQNTLMGRTFGSLLAKQYRMLGSAISERV